MSVVIGLLVLCGVILIGLSIWKIHTIREDRRAVSGDGFKLCPEYNRIRWIWIAICAVGALSIWGAGASALPAVNKTEITVVRDDAEYFVAQIVIQKQRDCTLARVWTEVSFTNDDSEVVNTDFSRIMRRGFEPDTVVIATKKDRKEISQITYAARYDCPLGFVMDTELGSASPKRGKE